MPEQVDAITFDKGINTRRNPASLADGELQESSGFAFNNDGYLLPLAPRTPLTMTQLGTIRNIHRYINWVLVQEGANLKYKWDLNKYCDLYVPPDNNFTQLGSTEELRCRIADYKTWTFIVNGLRNSVHYNGSLYTWGIKNPTNAPSATAGSSGNPNGDYTLYYTYLVKFPNGESYETAPSPSGTITGLTSDKIEWKDVSVCPYSGTGIVIHRRLYRYSATLGETYFVYEIPNNTDTTYSDDFGDSTININATLSTQEYAPPPDNLTAIEVYLQRLFGVKGKYLYWSEPYLPFAFKATSAIAVTDDGDDLTGCIAWGGDNLYLPSKSCWKRLSGSDSSTWSIKGVFADAGLINVDTIKKTKMGIIGLWYDGLYLFDGSISRNLTLKQIGTTLFTSTISDVDACYAEFDGTKYYFYYPTTGSTPNKCLVIDFTFYPELRFYHDPLILTAHGYHSQTGIRYMGYNGYQYQESSSGTGINLLLSTPQMPK